MSSVVYRRDKDLEDERNGVNVKLKKYCEGKGFVKEGNANVDIVSIAETKLGASFPSAQFTLEEYHTPYRVDINNKSSSICKKFNSITLPLL